MVSAAPERAATPGRAVDEQGRSSGLLLRDAALAEAERGRLPTRRSCSPTNRNSWLPAVRPRTRLTGATPEPAHPYPGYNGGRRGDPGHRASIWAVRNAPVKQTSQRQIAQK